MAIPDSEKNKVWSELKSKNFLQAFLSLKTENDAKDFLRDLMTEKEIIEFDMRWTVANLLNQGVSFIDIEKQTGATPRTIARVSKWLQEGCGGYKEVIDRLKSNAKS